MLADDNLVVVIALALVIFAIVLAVGVIPVAVGIQLRNAGRPRRRLTAPERLRRAAMLTIWAMGSLLVIIGLGLAVNDAVHVSNSSTNGVEIQD